jgi:hypothetical protein
VNKRKRAKDNMYTIYLIIELIVLNVELVVLNVELDNAQEAMVVRCLIAYLLYSAHVGHVCESPL